jgi:hypothetical protein
LGIIGIVLGLCVGAEASKYERHLHYFQEEDYDIVLMAFFGGGCIFFGFIFLIVGLCLIASCNHKIP